mgnify:FL=1
MSEAAPDRSGENNNMYGRRGALAPGWKGGKSSRVRIIRNSLELQKWRTIILERDDYTCKKCAWKEGIDYDGFDRKIETHHMIPFRQLVGTPFEKYITDPRNGVVLCAPCHRKLSKNKPKQYVRR